MKKLLFLPLLLLSIFLFGQGPTDHTASTGGQANNVTLSVGVLPIIHGGTNSTIGTGTGLPVFQTNPTITNATLATPTITVGAVTYTTSITLQSSDNYKFVDMNAAGTVTVTVPSYSVVAFANNTQITVDQLGAGQVVFVAGAGVNIYSEQGKLKLTAQFSYATLRKRSTGTNDWDLFGSLAP